MNNFTSRVIAAVLGAFLVLASQVSAQGTTNPNVRVEVLAASSEMVSNRFPARTNAIAAVDVVAEVTGVIQDIVFTGGQTVETGDLLYQIRDEDYRIALNAALAGQKTAEATLSLARATLERRKLLNERGSVASVEVEISEAEVLKAEASVLAAKSSVDQARLLLSRTKVVAPMSGVITSTRYSVGALVGPAQGPLTRVTQLDPIAIELRIPLSQLDADIVGGVALSEVDIHFLLPSGAEYHEDAALGFVEPAADASTNSAVLRAMVANADFRLRVGQPLTVVTARAPKEPQITINKDSVLLDREGPYVLVVLDSGVVELRRPQLGEDASRQRYVVLSGLSEGEMIFVGGHSRAIPGSIVSPVHGN
ncbi:efflux RND transporter periplasmic adaptor subunit [Shimia abyssi]|uniref:Membrane fusion protein (Multidrug efflux system)/multidrug efflux system membrane fusion protein n=1 Tax=Shimia abyssi TaxID=1662395 RepID=A0A2P8FDL6_9RHOB|nr:efflux RND transporter periplasmic adaptor subunit [Shimia abyssi]PSL19811.1 membrane fusion protein (multidrug efflux system)/multidrug efflux system membrane fusion protein [Shimia abyssi]